MSRNKQIDKQESNREDVEAVKAVLEGNSLAFSHFERKYKGIIKALIQRMIQDADDVEDLLQETFIKVYKALPGYKDGYSFSSWLYRIASNSCIDFLRKRRFNVISIDQPIGDEDGDSGYEISDDSYLPDINVLNEERKKALFEAIEKLPDNYRKIIEMRHIQELDYNQISEQLEIPLGTVKAHLFRARKKLLDFLKNRKHLFND